jgi:hypothetical protein
MGKLEKLFGVKKPIIGMLHLAGNGEEEKVYRALSEMKIYSEEGVSGVIVEDYHGKFNDVVNVMNAIRDGEFTSIVTGVNYLRDAESAVLISNRCGGRFVQLDSVQGKNNPLSNNLGQFIFGGVGFKYQPESGNSLENDLWEGMNRCDAIVTTGDGTGMETPRSKLVEYKNLLGNFPLIVGAGLNPENAYRQLEVADGAIVGSCFKPGGDTEAMVDRGLVKDLMDVVLDVRG